MATIKDIARIANVSPSTVSFVLNGKAREMKVSSATEQRILEIVAATGYRPSNVARRLRASEAERPVLALYWPLDRRASYVGRLLGAFQQEHLRQELDTIWWSIPSGRGTCARKRACTSIAHTAALF